MRAWFVLAAWALPWWPLFAQETRGSITGRVTDPSGAVIPTVKVEALNVATNVSVTAVTNEAGNYDIPYLLPGLYRLTAEAPGFKRTVRDGIELRVGDRLVVDLRLEVGAVTESVEVVAETPLLATATAAIGAVMGQRQITELPIVGGNPFYLARISAGVLSATGRGNGQNPFDSGSASTTVVVNGTRPGSSEVTLDGITNMFNNQTAFGPPQDLVQEFKINTAAYDATQGHATGAMVNVSLKSGTNQPHGTGYLFDSRLRARPWFLNRFLYDPNTGPITERKIKEATPGWLHQRWGYTITGPVVIPRVYDGRNRTFFAYGYEGVRVRRETTFTGTVPTPDEKRGDFSALLRLGAVYQIYDPATIAPAPGGRFTRQPLPGNVVPAWRIDPIAANILKYYPEPNSPGTADGRQNYFRIAMDNRRWASYLGRLDHNFSQRHRFFARFNANTWHQETQNMPTVANGNINRRPGYGLGVDDVIVFNPQLLLNVRYGFSWQRPSVSRFSQGFNMTQLGFPASLAQEIASKTDPAGFAFPEVVIDGGAFSTLGASGGNLNSIYYQMVAGTLTKIVATHSLRLGGEFRLMRENAYNYGNVAPRLEFAQTWTRGPLDNSPAAPIAQGLASMLLGYPTGGQVNVNASYAQQSTFTGLFFQDDWKLGPRLTLNIGLRYEYEGPTTERFNRSLRGFDSATPNPIEAEARARYAQDPIPEVPPAQFRTLGGLTFVGVGGQPRGLWTPDKNNLAPRFGLAWQPGSRTVVRAGYGIFFDLMGIDRQDVNQGGFNQATLIIPSLDNGLSFRARLSNPFPSGIERPPGAAAGLKTFLGRSIGFFAEQARNPYMQRWSLSVQRELLGRVVADLAYVGNRGTKLAVNTQLDPIPARYLSRSPERDQPVIDFLSAQVSNPFFGIADFSGSGLSGQRVARAQLLRPYPHFTGIAVNLPAGYSYYHSLQANFEKRMSHGLALLTAWTWSKFMEARSYLNDTDPRPEKVVSDMDFTHRLVVSAIYELPLGKGKRWLSGTHSWLDLIAGGWQLQGWFEGQTGDTLGFGNAIFRGSLKDIPLPVSRRRAERWFNVDAGFERDPRRQLQYNIRAFPTRFSGIRADGINNFDLSLFKSFPIREGWRFQFRMETYNTLNHVQFAAPNTSPTSSAFGSITSEKGHGQRQVTFAGKLIF